MHSENGHFYEFKSFRINLAERQLLNDKTPVPLTPKAFDVLAVLVERAGHLVEKDELMRLVWPDAFVEESNISRIIHTLRQALGEDDNGHKFIETVAKKGYRFVAEVEAVSENGAAPPTLDDQHLQKAARRIGPGTVLVLTAAVILAAVVTGIWFAARSRIAKTGGKDSTPQTNNGEAFQLYQQGRLLVERRYKGDLPNALANFEKAIELDPAFAGAYAGKADAKMWIFWGSPATGHDDISQARTAISRALELDESNAYAHAQTCRIKATYDWNFRGAEKECIRAIDLDPNDHEARREMAFLLSSLGREAEAMREIDMTIALAPTSFNKRSRGVILYYASRYDEAIEQLKQVEETDPGYTESRSWLMSCYEMKKDFIHALEARIRQMEHAEATPEEIAATKAAFDEGGWPGVLRTIVETKKGNLAGTAVYAQLGETDKAFESLEKAYERHAIMLVHAAHEPRFDPIRNDPRFDDLLKRIGLK